MCGGLFAYDGAAFHTVATRDVPQAFAEFRARHPPAGVKGSLSGLLLETGRPVQTLDITETELYRAGDIGERAVADLGGARTILNVPLLKDDAVVGFISVYRTEKRAFDDKQVALLQGFAAQAVIAMENAKLVAEQREALERQTATAEVLRTINASPGDLEPVFDVILAKAHDLCGATLGSLQLLDGEHFRAVATRGMDDAFATFLRRGYRPSVAATLPGEQSTQFADVTELARQNPDDPVWRATTDLGRIRTLLAVPLLKDGNFLGRIVAARQEVRPFTDKQIALLESFAAQAVIAIENARLLREQREALERQTATAEILSVINASPDDLAPVFDTMLGRAMQLCDAACGGLFGYDGAAFHTIATRGVPRAFAEFRARHPPIVVRGSRTGLLLETRRPVQTLDITETEGYRAGEAENRAIADLGGARTILNVPLLKDDAVVSFISVYRTEKRAFDDEQVALLQNFAAQAVIAMENARLITEQREALARQTATSEVLQVINSSPGDLGPVFEAMLEKAMRLCEATIGELRTYDGVNFRQVAARGMPDPYVDYYRTRSASYGPGTGPARIQAGEAVVHIPDLIDTEAYQRRDPDRVALVELGGSRDSLIVPLKRDDRIAGFIMILRDKVGAFSDTQIGLLQNFAAQAVIAMENARLLDEVRRREQELSVTFDNMGDGVAMFDADLRLAAWNRNFLQLMGLDEAVLAERPTYADYLRMLAERGEFGIDNIERELANRLEHTERELRLERTRPDGTMIEVRRNAVPGGGFVLIYSDMTERKQAELAIRAARDAAESALERQTVTADILKVIAGSPTDVQPVLEAVVNAAVRFCGAADATILLRDGDGMISRAHQGPLSYNAGDRRTLDRGAAGGRAIVDGLTCHLPDTETLDPVEFASARRLATLHGFRAVVAAPLKREDTAIGAVVLRKTAPGPFAPQQIELLETFAAQAVIAIENVRLFTELRESLERLKAAQANLIQAEKMASLGQLTAGIAHEIKNPLNFVNNFAELSVELLDELKQATAPTLAGLEEDQRAEILETIQLLTGNLEKIAEHGRRADGIVKSMLAHSRGGSGDWQASNINSLIEEALNLAYHGARAQDQSFNVTLERDFDGGLKPIDLVPQDVTRVFLNLMGNGFYATRRRQRVGADDAYRPTLRVSTHELGEAVEIRVRDNGIGMGPEVRAKLFQPFFTTKPTGEGTGLGLSISYDIVTQQHGGSIEVDSEPGQYSEFIVRLPRRVAVRGEGQR